MIYKAFEKYVNNKKTIISQQYLVFNILTYDTQHITGKYLPSIFVFVKKKKKKNTYISNLYINQIYVLRSVKNNNYSFVKQYYVILITLYCVC